MERKIIYENFEEYNSLPVSPREVQRFIDENIKHSKKSSPPVQSILTTLKKGKGNCIESAVLAARALEEKFGSELLFLSTDKNVDHAVYLFKEKNLFGAVGNSRSPNLKWREPIYKDLPSLVKSFERPLLEFDYKLISASVVDLDYLFLFNWKNSSADYLHCVF